MRYGYSCLLAASLFPNYIQAERIHFTGNIVERACAIDQGSYDQVVNLGTLGNKKLQKPNSKSAWRAFQIKLIRCPESVSLVEMTLNGNSPSYNSTLYKNIGTAENVDVEVALGVMSGDNYFSQGPNTKVTSYADSMGSVNFAFTARMYSVQGEATPGTVESVMQFTLQYP